MARRVSIRVESPLSLIFPIRETPGRKNEISTRLLIYKKPRKENEETKSTIRFLFGKSIKLPWLPTALYGLAPKRDFMPKYHASIELDNAVARFWHHSSTGNKKYKAAAGVTRDRSPLAASLPAADRNLPALSFFLFLVATTGNRKQKT